MPIYAYRCAACGHAKDVLQKVSDPLLTVCPACGAAAFQKQVTAAGFQLKGSGWYVTDFRGGDNKGGKPADDGGEKGGDKGDAAKGAPAEGAKSGDGSSAAPAKGDAAAAPAAAPAATPAPAPPAGAPPASK